MNVDEPSMMSLVRRHQIQQKIYCPGQRSNFVLTVGFTPALGTACFEPSVRTTSKTMSVWADILVVAVLKVYLSDSDRRI